MKRFLLILLLLLLPIYTEARSIIILGGDAPAAVGGECTVDTDERLQSSIFTYEDSDTVDSATEFMGQSFQHTAAFTVTQILLTLRDNNQTGTCTLRIETDNTNKPSGTLASDPASTVSVGHASVPDDFGITTFTFATPFALLATTKYWIVLKTTDGMSFTSYLSSTSKYASGNYKYTSNSGTDWTDYATLDIYFDLYGCD